MPGCEGGGELHVGHVPARGGVVPVELGVGAWDVSGLKIGD